MLELILAIISFIMSFLPNFGMYIALICSGVAIVLSIVNIKKIKENNKNKEIYIISIVIAIFAIIFGIVLFCISSRKTANNTNEKVANYEEYNLSDDIELGNGLNILLVNFTSGENIFRANIDVKSSIDGAKISIYDFFLMDLDNNKEYFPLYNEGNASIINLNSGEKTNLNIYFSVKEKVLKNTYLMYKNGDIKVKVKI